MQHWSRAGTADEQVLKQTRWILVLGILLVRICFVLWGPLSSLPLHIPPSACAIHLATACRLWRCFHGLLLYGAAVNMC